MRDASHCKMNPELMDMVEGFYDYSTENLEFLQKKFENLQIKKLSEINNKPKELTNTETHIEEEEWEDEEILSEGELEVLGEHDTIIENSKGRNKSSKEVDYVLVKGYWRPLKDKLLTSKFQVGLIESNDKGELILPGGDIIGNKKFAKYYKQNMHDSVKRKDELIKAITHREMRKQENLTGQSRALILKNNQASIRALER